MINHYIVPPTSDLSSSLTWPIWIFLVESPWLAQLDFHLGQREVKNLPTSPPFENDQHFRLVDKINDTHALLHSGWVVPAEQK